MWKTVDFQAVTIKFHLYAKRVSSLAWHGHLHRFRGPVMSVLPPGGIFQPCGSLTKLWLSPLLSELWVSLLFILLFCYVLVHKMRSKMSHYYISFNTVLNTVCLKDFPGLHHRCSFSFFNLFICFILFIFGCIGSLLLCGRFL